MKNLRTQFERFCYRNRDKGIHNLMLYIVIGTAIVYTISQIAGNYTLYYLLCFDRSLILQGQVWRLFTYALTYGAGSNNAFIIVISLLVYYTLGTTMERNWGTCKFNLFYFSGIVLMDIYCMIFGTYADVTYLNTSLFLAYATMYPDAGFLLFFIIPVKAWLFGLFDLILVLANFFLLPFPDNLFPIISLANYFLFFGSDVLNLLPRKVRMKAWRKFKKKGSYNTPWTKVIQFEARKAPQQPQPPQPGYNHKCTVCGRTDVSNPELEFRYCSRCNGFHCYCSDHISNHAHIE